MSLTIKQVMEKTGISADTLRYYEKEGLLSPKRSENGYRQYDDDDITILKNIIVMKYAHFTLNEMKSMEEMYARNPSANCNEICQGILNSKVTELRQVICNYQKIVLLLEELLKMIGGVEAYLANKERVDEFIQQIFDDIQNGEG